MSPSNEPTQLIDLELLKSRMRRILNAVGKHDFLLHRVGDDFAERISLINRTFSNGVSVGSYNGVVSRAVAACDNVGDIIDFEPSTHLLAHAPGLKVQGDLEALPFGSGVFDLAVSGLAFQLVNDLPGTLIQICRSLKPDGLLLAAMLGGESLKELRHSWMLAEDELRGGVSPRVVPFPDMRDVGGLLQRAGFSLPVVDSELVTVRYPSALALMREIKAMGVSNPLAARQRQPITRSLLARAAAIYEDTFVDSDGRVPATFEILTLTAWVPHESQQKPLKPGAAEHRLADVLGVDEQSAGEKAGR